MRSRSKLTTACLLIGATVIPVVPLWAGGPEVPISPERTELCARADKRYAELYPDAKDDGAVIVKLYKYNFCPANVTIKTGTTVRWINIDKRTSHSVWLKQAGEAESERFFPEEQWEFPFMAAGDYPYLCGPHWQQEDMIGYVKVVD